MSKLAETAAETRTKDFFELNWIFLWLIGKFFLPRFHASCEIAWEFTWFVWWKCWAVKAKILKNERLDNVETKCDNELDVDSFLLPTSFSNIFSLFPVSIAPQITESFDFYFSLLKFCWIFRVVCDRKKVIESIVDIKCLVNELRT